ncbi:MAG: HEAT repeat domain-containing protein [Gemmataceae bacterium]
MHARNFRIHHGGYVMTCTSFTVALLLWLPAQGSVEEKPRQPNPFAPSLPLLTRAEEDQLDAIIERFIRYDLGELTGAEGKKALQDFQRLGPEATFALIRGVNRAAEIEASCPVVVIARKLNTMLASSQDPQLLQFARENIGAGVRRTKHLGILKDLQYVALSRYRTVLAQQAAARKTPPGAKSVRDMSVTELADASASERGEKLKEILTELEQRRAPEVIDALGAASVDEDEEIKQLARQLLVRHLARLPQAALPTYMGHDRREVRAGAAVAASVHGLRLVENLLQALADDEDIVRQAARGSLVRLARGADFGPERDASPADRAEAVRQWRAWYGKVSGK